MRPLRILTWHTHGAYLYYLTQVSHTFYVMSKSGRPPGYGGRCGELPWGDNVIDLPVEQACRTEFDCILFQDDAHYLEDQFRYLTPAQRDLPRIYLEHDPPRDSPTDARHPVDDEQVLLVHVTHYNALMWDSGDTPVKVIEHGVVDPGYRFGGELPRGLVIINDLDKRGRRLGLDVFLEMRERVPLDLVGMGAERLGGLGEIAHRDLAAFAARYRFLFNPIRHTSLGLAVVEAMMAGLPVVGLATTEMATAVDDGVSGYIGTDLHRLRGCMHRLLEDPQLARQLGREARRQALARFGIERFVADWTDVFFQVTGTPSSRRFLYSTGHHPR